MSLKSNERGAALVTVLIVMLIALILGMALLQTALSDITQAARQEKKTTAYYLARSGADAVASYLMENPDELPAVINYGPDEVYLDNGKFVVTVTEQGETIMIESIGYCGDFSDKVILTLNRSGPILDTAVFSLTTIKLEGSCRVDKCGTNSTAPDSVTFEWSTGVDGDLYIGPGGDPDTVIQGPRGSAHVSNSICNLNEIRSYPLPPFPGFPTTLPFQGNFTAGWWPKPPYQISEDGQYDELKVLSELIIDLGSGARHIRARELIVTGDGKITLRGEGTLYLYVDEKFTFENGATINNGGDSNQVLLYYKGSNPVRVPDNTKLYGSLYAEKADISFANGGSITGNVITAGSSVTLTGASSILVGTVYAPNADVVMMNGTKIYGSVIGKSFEARGDCRVYHESTWNQMPLPSIDCPGLKIGHWKKK